MTERFRVDVVRRDGRIVLRPIGDFDLAAVGAFEEAVEAVEVVVGDPVVVVDLRAVTFMDSSALHVLLRAAQRLGSRLHLVPGPPHVNRVFELTATWERFEFVDPSVVDVSDDERDG